MGMDQRPGLAELYQQIRATVQYFSPLTETEFDDRLADWRNLSEKFQEDRDFFERLVIITFHSGFKSTTAGDRMDTILDELGDYSKVKGFTFDDVERLCKEENMIKSLSKISATIMNAREFDRLTSKSGSFKDYLQQRGFRTDDWDDAMDRLVADLKTRFYYLGPITAYHFLMDIGAFVAKPDRQIVALFSRLGLLDSRDGNVERTAIDICRQMAKQAKEDIRVVDIVLVNMGQGSEFGLEQPICTTGCEHCQVKGPCKDRS